ncbi:MAG: DNA repair protein RecN [Gallionellaceae bacterium]|nr:DNA repair protein RecN [Gallionellaceae bacterium]
MLLSLTLSDFVLVDRLELDFHAGFSVLTGETGAGKSILLDALSLVLGERAEAGVVREGTQRAEVAAEFSLEGLDELAVWLEENDLAGEEGVLLLRRVIEAGGRSRAFINGRAATAQQLKVAGEHLVDIHGQHAHYSLLKSAEQRRLLDAYAGSTPLAAEVADAFRAWREARARRENAESHAGEQEAERERLTWTVNELTTLAFSHEGWTASQEEHRRLAHAADLLAGSQAAAALLDDDGDCVLSRLRDARGKLSELAEIDPGLAESLGMLESAADTLHEAARELTRYAERVDLDPQALSEAEARIAAVQDAARKFRLRPEDIPQHLAEASAQLLELGAAGDLEALKRAEAKAEAGYRKLAGKLTQQRGEAAGRLDKAVSAAMQHLAMQGGAFEAGLVAGEPAAHGLEDIEFRVSPHAGQSLKPLAKTASGGELSRIGLGLQTVLSGVSGAPTLIFDEVDSGIGGGVAEIVGRLLADLGQSRQVLCVTHLPQVAARAAQHYQVSKSTQAGHALSRVVKLESEARVEEVARMLGGVKLTEATREHAGEMLRGTA